MILMQKVWDLWVKIMVGRCSLLLDPSNTSEGKKEIFLHLFVLPLFMNWLWQVKFTERPFNHLYSLQWSVKPVHATQKQSCQGKCTEKVINPCYVLKESLRTLIIVNNHHLSHIEVCVFSACLILFPFSLRQAAHMLYKLYKHL